MSAQLPTSLTSSCRDFLQFYLAYVRIVLDMGHDRVRVSFERILFGFQIYFCVVSNGRITVNGHLERMRKKAIMS